MRLVVFGLAMSSSWGNGHATLWRGLVAALGKMGHHVTFFEKDVPWYALHRDLTELPHGELVVYPSFADVREKCERALTSCDVAIITSYCPDAEAASRLVLDSKALKVFYDLDTPVTLEHLDRGEPVEYLPEAGLGAFDLVLSYTGGGALRRLRALGAKDVRALFGHVDPAQHHPVAPIDTLRGDLSYLGTYSADRQAALDRLFLEPARRLRDRRFILGGSQYPADFPWTPNVHYVRHVPPPEHPAFYCSSRLTLNVTRGPMAALGECPSARLFESAACGVPVLTDPWAGLARFFTPGEEILVAENTTDAREAVLLPDAVLAKVAKRARERTLAEHTAEHRGRELLFMFESRAPAPRKEETDVGHHPGGGAR